MSFEESTLQTAGQEPEAESRTRGGRLLPLLVAVDLGLAVALSLAPIVLGACDPATAAAEPAAGLALAADEAIHRIAPALPQIINLALLDPQLASSMVPDEWIDGGIESARIIAHEQPRPRPGAVPPQAWPFGPFSTAHELERSIRSLDPAAAAALYGALGPRIAARCRAKGASFARCDQEIRMSLERLAEPVVSARVAGRDDVPITDTQLEFARLGAEVVSAGKAKIEAVRRAVWPVQR